MLSIHLEIKDSSGEDETNYKTDEIRKENMKEVCIFIADQKSENTKHPTKIRQANLVQVLSKEERVEWSKRRTFFRCKTFAKEKNGVANKPSTLTYFQRSVQLHLNTRDSTENLQREHSVKLLKFLARC